MAQSPGFDGQRRTMWIPPNAEYPNGMEIDVTDASERELDYLYRQYGIIDIDIEDPNYDKYRDVEPKPDRWIGGQLAEFVKGVPRGIEQSGLQWQQGIAGASSIDEDTDWEKRIRVAQAEVRDAYGANPDYEDSWGRKFGEAVGSGAAFVGASVASRGLLSKMPLGIRSLSTRGRLAAEKGLTRVGVPATYAPGIAAALESGVVASVFSSPVQMGQHAGDLYNYETMTGEDVPSWKEAAGYAGAAATGLTEGIGLGSIAGAGKQALSRSALASTLLRDASQRTPGILQRSLSGAVQEAFQESLLQALPMTMIESSYNDQAYEDLGKELWDSAIYGGGAGGVITGMMHLMARSVGGRPMGWDLATRDALENHRIGLQNMGRLEGRTKSRILPTQFTPELSEPELRRRAFESNYDRMFPNRDFQFGTANPNLTEEQRAELQQNMVDLYLGELAVQEKDKVANDENYQPLSQEEMQAEAQRRADQKQQDDLRFYQESRQNEEDIKSEVGLPFVELDNIGAKPIQEILDLVLDGTITLEEFQQIVTTDRLSRIGDIDRDELRDFAILNSFVNNRFDSGAAASFILMSDPTFIEEQTRQIADAEVQQELNRRIEEAQREGKTIEPESRPATPEEREAFKAIGEQQRDVPEDAMLRVRQVSDGGVLGTLVEHVGDLTHRMTHDMGGSGIAKMDLTEKINRTLGQLLTNPESSIAGQMRDVAQQRGVPLETLQADTDVALAEYAEAHRALPAYNEMQRLARDAAVAIGEKNFGEATRLLQELQTIVNSPTFHTDIYNIEVPGRIVGKKPPTKLTKKVEKGIRDEVINNVTSVDLFGEGTASQKFEVARQLLANRISNRWLTSVEQLEMYPSMREVLTFPKAYLSPVEINGLIAEVAANTPGFDVNKAYDLLYANRGTLAIAQGVEGTTQVNDVALREDAGTKQIELKFADKAEQDVVKLAQEQMEAKSLEGTQKQFEKAILDLLKAKNININYHTGEFGLGGMEGIAFRTLVQAVTGHGSIKQVKNRAQRRMLYGHIMNMPTFSESTYLPDLSTPTYTTTQLRATLEELRAVDGPSIRAWTLFENMNKRDVPEARIPDTKAGQESYKQLIRHLLENGYVDWSGRGRGIRIGLAEDNRSHARTPAVVEQETARAQFEQDEQARDQERREYDKRLKDQAKNDTAVRERADKLVELLANTVYKKYGIEPELLKTQLGREITDPLLRAFVGEDTNVIQNPAEIENRLGEFNTDTGQLFINLSRADPDGTRDIQDIVNDLALPIFGGFLRMGGLGQVDINALDKGVRMLTVPESTWEEEVAPRVPGNPEYKEVNFLEAEDMINPEAGKGEVFQSARELLMSSLMKNQLSPAKTAGQIGHIQRLGNIFFGKHIEANKSAEIGELMSLLNRFQTGQVARGWEAPPKTTATPEGTARSLIAGDYVAPELLEELQKTVVSGDTKAQGGVLKRIFQQQEIDQTLADAPTPSWEATMFSGIFYEDEVNSTLPGTVPSLGQNASDNAIEAYFAQKLGRKPYIMPEVAKSRFRNRVSWTPTAELKEIIKTHGNIDIGYSVKLTGEQLLDNYKKIFKEVDMETKNPDGEPTVEDMMKWLEATRKVTEESRQLWSSDLGFSQVLTREFWNNIGQYARRKVIWEGNVVELQDQLIQLQANEMRSLSEYTTAGILQHRTNSSGLSSLALNIGHIAYIGTPENGYPQVIQATPGETTMQQTIALLQGEQDIRYAGEYIAALRWLAYRQSSELLAKQMLADAEVRGIPNEIRFFAKNSESRIWGDGTLSEQEQLEATQKIVSEIETNAPHIKKFAESVAEYNRKYWIPFQLATKQITPAIAEFAAQQPFAPLNKNIGEEAAWPLGSNGRPSTKRIKGDELYQHSLDDFNELDQVDVIQNIQGYNYRMIRDGLSNIGALRAEADAVRMTEMGLGQQSINVTEELTRDEKTGLPIIPKRYGNVMRLLRDGVEEYHEMADPLQTQAIMTTDIGLSNPILKVIQGFTQAYRTGVIIMPNFVVNNFTRDAKVMDVQYGGSSGSWLPFQAVYKQLLRASEPKALLRMKLAGFATTIGPSSLPELEAAGAGQTTTFRSKPRTGVQIADQARREIKFQEFVDKAYSEGKVDMRSFSGLSDFIGILGIGYRNLLAMSESTARLSGHDITLARTGSASQAQIDGLEVLNYGKKGASKTLMQALGMFPFTRGNLIGVDTFIKAFTGSPDAPGAHLGNGKYLTQTWLRAIRSMLGPFLIAQINQGGEEDDQGRTAYDRRSNARKFSYDFIPLTKDVAFELPIGFESSTITEFFPKVANEYFTNKEFTGEEALYEMYKRARRTAEFSKMPSIVNAFMNQRDNRNSFTGQPIVSPWHRNLPPELQRGDQVGLVEKGVGEFTNVSPLRIEQLVNDIFSQLGVAALSVANRSLMELTGDNTVGTQHDWDLNSFMLGEGIENVPGIGKLFTNTTEDKAALEDFYKLDDFFSMFSEIQDKVKSIDNIDTLEERYKNIPDLEEYEALFSVYRGERQDYRDRIRNIQQDASLSDAEKRARIVLEQKEHNGELDGLTDIILGIKDTGNIWEFLAPREERGIVGKILGGITGR